MADSAFIATTTYDEGAALRVDGRTVIDGSAQYLSAIRTQLSVQHALLFARPARRSGSTEVDWYASVSGTASAVTELPSTERERVMAQVASLVNDVRGLGQTLAARDQTAVVALGRGLIAFARMPSVENVYVVGAQPVVVGWGIESPPTMTTTNTSHHKGVASAVGPSTNFASPDSEAASGPDLATDEQTPRLHVQSRSPALWWRWPVLALMTLALLGMVWWAQRPLEPVLERRTGEPADLGEEIITKRTQKRDLLDELLTLDRRREALAQECTAMQEEPAKPPPAPKPEPVIAQAKPEPTEKPIAKAVPKPPTPTAPPPKPKRRQPKPMDTPPKPVVPVETTASKPKPACATRKPYESPEVMLVVDASGSMRDPIRGARNRMDASKRAIATMVERLPEDVDVGLIEFSDCGKVDADRFYRFAERSQLVQRVARLQPLKRTPLARAIERAGRRTSNDVDVVIVVVSDGQDSCGGDACAVAQQLARSKPRATINVIDIGDGKNPTAQCIARAGRGRVFQPNSTAEMAQMIKRATGEPDMSQCKK